MWSIYVIRNAATEKLYVGQTVKNPPTKRWSDHLYRCRSGERKRLYESIRKHGVVAFEFTVIEHWETQADANEAEEFWVSFFRSWDAAFGYNMTLGGDGSVLSPSVIEHLRKLNAGERNPFHGKHHSEDAKRRIRAAARNPSDETREKLRDVSRRHRAAKTIIMRDVANKLWADPAHRAAMSQKQRAAWTKRRTKLSTSDVTRVLERLSAGEKACVIAKDFNVSPAMITAVKQGRYVARDGEI